MTRLAALFLVGSACFGCSCAGWPSAREAWEQSDLVFTATVTGAFPGSGWSTNPLVEIFFAKQRVRIRVEEAFKGVKVGDELRLEQPLGNSCSWALDSNARLLLYLRAPVDGVTSVTPCWRNRSVAEAADDFAFLRKLPASAQQSRVSGVLSHYKDGHAREAPSEPLSGVRVRIKGPVEKIVTTDANGLFEIYGLPDGEYRVEPLLPQGTRVWSASFTGRRWPTSALLNAKSRAVSVNFYIAPD